MFDEGASNDNYIFVNNDVVPVTNPMSSWGEIISLGSEEKTTHYTGSLTDTISILGSATVLDAVSGATYDAAIAAAQCQLSATQPNLAVLAAGIAAGALDLENAIDGMTLRQALQVVSAIIAGLAGGFGTSNSQTKTFKGLDQQTDRVTMSADNDGNRTSVEYHV